MPTLVKEGVSFEEFQALSMPPTSSTTFDFAASRSLVSDPANAKPPGKLAPGRFRTHYSVSANSLAIKLAGGENAMDSSVSPLLVIMIHGILGPSVVWGPLEQVLTSSDGGEDSIPLFILKYDLCGRGFTGSPPSQKPFRYDLPDYMEQLDEILSHVLAEEVLFSPLVTGLRPLKVCLVAHSMGGIIASTFAARQSRSSGYFRPRPEINVFPESVILLAPAGAIDAPIGKCVCCFSCLQCCIGCTPGCIDFVGRTIIRRAPLNQNFVDADDNDGGVSAETLARGTTAKAWSTAWSQHNALTNGGAPIAASIARMPFTGGVRSLVAQDNHPVQAQPGQPAETTAAKGNVKVNILVARNDPTCRNIRIDEYSSLFGAQNVSSEDFPGRHMWFVQDDGTTNERVLSILKANHGGP
jgi:pimeloyl-ACP methyl ester carboxylesterase